MIKPIRRIAICTGGGDAPGLNAVIRATVTAAANRGWAEAAEKHLLDLGVLPPRPGAGP